MAEQYPNRRQRLAYNGKCIEAVREIGLLNSNGIAQHVIAILKEVPRQANKSNELPEKLNSQPLIHWEVWEVSALNPGFSSWQHHC